MNNTYTINFENNSGSGSEFCLFQQKPGGLYPDHFALAWRVEHAVAGAKVPISWNTDMYFFWARPGVLKPGIIFNAGDAKLTSLAENNAITLTKEDQNYKFTDQKNWNQIGLLSITCDNTVVPDQASVGVGMSGACAFAAQAQPNMTFQFRPHPQYWAAFGAFQQGQLLNGATENAVEIVFPAGVYSMNVTINEDHTWTITPGFE